MPLRIAYTKRPEKGTDRERSSPLKQGSTAARGVVVVDRRPLERNLVRFILQENGFDVTATAATPADALRTVVTRRPAVVVLHENAAWEGGRPTIPELRRALPDAKVLVIAPAFGVVRVELLRDADAVLEEGVGFKDLPFVIGRLASGEVVRDAPSAGDPAGTSSPAPPFRERWVNRFQGATAAAIVFLAFLIAGAAGPPGPARVGATPAVALARAQNSLEDLHGASNDEVINQAIELAADRAAAIDAGANVSTLDAQIKAVVDEVLPGLPPDVAGTLLLVLSDALDAATPTPTPTPAEETPSPEPSPREEPSPTPDAVASVTPVQEAPAVEESPASEEQSTEEPSPHPSEHPSPRPTEEPSPSPTEEPSPSPTAEPSPREQPSPSPTQQPSEEEPSPSPAESPTETTSPSVSETPSLTPTESPSTITSPTPSETPSTITSPTPSEAPSPTSTETPTPSPTETATPADATAGDGVAVLVLPPGIGVLASAIARRRARRPRG
jgi:hypothetical protein